jgi:hypothetical protein
MRAKRERRAALKRDGDARLKDPITAHTRLVSGSNRARLRGCLAVATSLRAVSRGS